MGKSYCKKWGTGAVALLLLVILLAAPGCALQVQAANLMEGVTASKVTERPADDLFANSMADFSVALFQKAVKAKENSLVSPLSVMLALAMTANGAGEETLAEMERLLGGNIPLAELNEYLYSYVKGLPSTEKSKFSVANSVWFRDDADKLTVQQSFLQKNADYYNAAAYKAAFDGQTLKDINNWVKEKTNGLIDKVLEEIGEEAMLYLINAIVFDAEWETVYSKESVREGEFRALGGISETVKMMHSKESMYIKTENATGFLKNYKDAGYAFAAFLPGEGMDINDYIASLTGEGFLAAVKGAKRAEVIAQMPKFSYDYSVTLNDPLKALGMEQAFDGGSADFNGIGHSAYGNLYVSNVLHKTFIAVDERGTKAGAVTAVEISAESAPAEQYTVKLDRPFVYAIIDNATGLPIFIGTVLSVNG